MARRPASDPSSTMPARQALAAIVESRPTPRVHGVVRWRLSGREDIRASKAKGGMLVVTQDTCRPISPGASAAAMGEVYAPDAPNGRTKCRARSSLCEPGKPTQIEKGPDLSVPGLQPKAELTCLFLVKFESPAISFSDHYRYPSITVLIMAIWRASTVFCAEARCTITQRRPA